LPFFPRPVVISISDFSETSRFPRASLHPNAICFFQCLRISKVLNLTGGSAINPVERRANACLTLLQADAASALLGKVMKPGSVSANALEARIGMHTADITKMDRCSFGIRNNPFTVACSYNAKNRIAIDF